MFSWPIIKNLIDTSGQPFHELVEIYNAIPEAHCSRRGLCCALLPEMTLMEALSAFRSLIRFDPVTRNRIFKKIVGYFFLNALEIPSCPFLEGKHCLIYSERFFGCRAYGLWSVQYYEKRALSNRKAKKELQKNWRRLGVSLPKTVINFHQPYCLNVTPPKGPGIDDMVLNRLADRIEMLSHRFSHWNQLFGQTYQSDISFLSASLVFGVSQAIQIKLSVVRDTLNTGNRKSLIRVLEELPNFDELV